MDLRKFNVVVRRLNPTQDMVRGEEVVLPADSPDEEHAISAATSNAIAFTTKVQASSPLPIAFCCVGIENRD